MFGQPRVRREYVPGLETAGLLVRFAGKVLFPLTQCQVPIHKAGIL